MLEGPSKIAQVDSEPAAGHLSLLLIEAYLKLNKNVDEERSNVNGDDNIDESDTYFTNSLEVMKLVPGVPSTETSYSKRAKESKSYNELQDVSKEVWNRLFWAFGNWLKLGHTEGKEQVTVKKVSEAEEREGESNNGNSEKGDHESDSSDEESEESDDEMEETEERHVVRVTGLPEMMLLTAMLDPRIHNLIQTMINEIELAKCANLVCCPFIETATCVRLNKEKVREGSSTKQKKGNKKRKKSKMSQHVANCTVQVELESDEGINFLLINLSFFSRSIFSHKFSSLEINEKDKPIFALWSKGWKGFGGCDSHCPAKTPSMADIKLGIKASEEYWLKLEELELSDWPEDDHGKKQMDERLDLQNMETYDYQYAFQIIKIMEWVNSWNEADEVTEVTRITLSAYLNSKAANAMVERFFSTVGLVACSKNMNLHDEKIEMRALVKANDAIIRERLHCEMLELPESRTHVPYNSEIVYSSRNFRKASKQAKSASSKAPEKTSQSSSKTN